MSLFNKLISGLGILCAFGCTNAHDEQERKDLIKWLNHYIEQISLQVASDIVKEKKGFFPHSEKANYNSKGYIQYELQEKTGKRLEISERSLLTLNDIENTDGYKHLISVCNDLNIKLSLEEINVDGDEVEDSSELDEYIDDEARYFVIRIADWLAE